MEWICYRGVESGKKEKQLDELAHHGILGMKWGVRRYQNYDGSYTRAGLKRYRDAESSYKNATSKTDKKVAKNEMKKAFKGLKSDRSADRGKKLTQEGYTIREIKTKRALGNLRSALAGGTVGSALSLISSMWALPIAAPMIAAAATAGGGIGLVSSMSNRKIKDLKEYRKRLN